MIIPLVNSPTPPSDARIAALLATLRGGNLTSAQSSRALDVPAIVRDILGEVRSGGDAAAARLTSKLDRAAITPQSLRVPTEVIAAAHRQVAPEFLEMIRRVIANIREFQEHIRWQAPAPLLRGGRRLGVRYTPLDRVAVYVPGGQALYPSTVLMTAVPAMVAGVPEIVLASPPTGGEIDPMVLALAHELGISEVYRLGGAVAIAALAYGTESIRPVHKVCGPGNAFVAEAKRQLFGVIGIDSIAGPSDLLAVAEEGCIPPSWLAADLLAQAEHNPGSAVLVTPSTSLAEAVVEEIERQVKLLTRREFIEEALSRYGAIVVTPDLDSACELANLFAPEHLQLATHDDKCCLAKIRHFGTAFIGKHSTVPLGDYFAGPSHVLPTGGTAKFFGPLSCNDFLKASNTIEYDEGGNREDGPSVVQFASHEGFTGHAEALSIRLRS